MSLYQGEGPLGISPGVVVIHFDEQLTIAPAFGAETWVLTQRIERALESFLYRAARRITRKQPHRGRGGQWTYPPMKEAMREAGFEWIWKAITRRQNTVAQYIVTRPILDLFEQATHRMGARVSRRWWDQEGIDLKAEKERSADSTATDSESESEAD